MTKKSKAATWPDLMGPAFSAFNPLQAAESPGKAGNPFGAGMEFMKSFWGALPGANASMTTPALNLDDLDRRIKDLRAVESWLELNANMLKATIQGLEVQRNTLVAMQSFSHVQQDAFDKMAKAQETMRPKPAAGGSGSSQTDSPSEAARFAPPGGKAQAAPAALAWMNYLQEQFTRMAQASLASTAPGRKTQSPAGPATAAPSPARRPKKSAKKSARRAERGG